MDNRPIGIFDSGLGGLTVLKEYLEKLPNENYIYFGDNARVPYGSKSPETIIEYARQIINFLLKKDVKLIIIACGTVSATAFEILKDEFSIPIQTVILPTAEQLQGKKIGVIATKATIASGAWEKAINKYHPTYQVFSKACPLFVPLVEESLANSNITQLTISMYLQEFIDLEIDHLILGCTHYPILQPAIQAFLPNSINIVSVNSSVIKETENYLTETNALCMARRIPERIAYTTDSIENFQHSAKAFCDIEFHQIEKVALEQLQF